MTIIQKNAYDAIIAGFLEPIAGSEPCGENIAYSGKLEHLTTLRSKGEWSAVAENCAKLLRDQTKDLRLAVWWVDATIHLDGASTLAIALDMLQTFCDRFWPDLYPKIDADDPDVRMAPFFWLAERLPVTVSSLTITNTSDERAISYTDYVNATRLERLFRRDPAGAEKSIKKGALRLPELEQLFINLGLENLKNVRDDLTTGWEAAGALTIFLDSHYGDASPSFAKANDIFGELIGVLSGLLEGLQPSFNRSKSRRLLSADDDADFAALPASTPANRLDAYAQLQVIAQFLKQTEPHSPVPHLLDLAHRWGALPIDELMIETLQLKGEVPALFNLLGWCHSSDIEEQIKPLAVT